MLKERLPLIGALCLLILTITNFTAPNESITGIVGIVLFIFVLILYFISRKNNVEKLLLDKKTRSNVRSGKIYY